MGAIDVDIASARIVTPEGERPGVVRVRGGRIESVADRRGASGAARFVDVGSHAVMAGVIDAHVHVNEPGRTEWEGFETAGRAAAAGGVTTMAVMPLNCTPAATSVRALGAEGACAEGRCAVDVALWGGVVPGNTGELREMWEAGAAGFKCFLVHSGVDDFPNVEDADLRAAMAEIARLGDGNVPLLVHAEDAAVIAATRAGSGIERTPRKYAAYLATRPPESEVAAVRRMVQLCRETGCRVHIVHVSAAESLPVIAAAKAEGLPITAETCPHYLVFAAEEIGDGRTEFKCAPPIRGAENRERLWEGLRSGVLDLIASDHSPCPPEMKRLETGDFDKAWGGISSLQLTLGTVWTEARVRGFGLAEVSRWLSAAPARLAGVESMKGSLRAGMDADVVVFDTEREWRITGAALAHRHPLTPYDGREVRGAVVATLVRGRVVFDPGGVLGGKGADGPEAIGRWVKRARA